MRTQNSRLLGAALQAMHGRRALIVGDLMLDAYVYGETLRVSREAPVLVVRKERLEHRLGGAANTAANLTTLGLHTQVLGVAGQDASGALLLEMLAQAGAKVHPVQPVARTTPVKTRILAGAFGTSRQQILRLDDEPQGPIDAAILQGLAEQLPQLAAGVDVVVVSDYGAGVVTGPLLQAVIDLAHVGKPVCVDSRYQLRRFKGVTAVTPNVPEAEAALGFAVSNAEAVQRAGDMLLRSLECGACLITQGRMGLTLFEGHATPSHVDIVGDKEVTDVTGAGDTVIATLSAALAAGLGLQNGMRLANCAAGVVVTKMGAACASPGEIISAAQLGGVELQPWDA